MLEIFDFFIVALAPALRSAQNLLKKLVSAFQLGTYEIRVGIGTPTLTISFLRLKACDKILESHEPKLKVSVGHLHFQHVHTTGHDIACINRCGWCTL
jgi:hypothetical protein